MIRTTSRRRCDPDLFLGIEKIIFEILIEEAELPKLVGNIFPDIRYRPIRSDDDFVILMSLGIETHDPASGILTLLLEKYGVFFPEQTEGMIPKLQVEDVAFARQKIVADIDASHGPQMALNNFRGDDFSHLCRFVLAFFDFLQSLRAQIMFGIFSLIKTRNASINVPAVIIEFVGSGGGHPAYIFERFSFNVLEPDDYISDLYAGVVDVILDLDLTSGRSKNSNECVSDCRIAKVANVRSFVGVDVCMLDDDLSFIRRKPPQTAPANRCCTIQVEIHVAGAGNFHALDAFDFPYLGDKFFRNCSRSLFELTRKLKRNGCSEFAKVDLGSLV